MVGEDPLNATGKKKKKKKKKTNVRADGEDDDGGFPIGSTNDNEPLLKARQEEEVLR